MRRSQWRKQRLLILCYHGLSLQDEHEWLPHLFITPDTFRKRLATLRDMNVSVLPLGEALSRLRSGSLPPASVALTFDDGFFDFLQNGVPLLSEFAFPCTLYLTTHYVKNRYPIANLALDYVLWKSCRASVRLPDFGIDSDVPILSYAERQKLVWRVLDQAGDRGVTTAGKDEIVRSIADDLGVDYQLLLGRRMLQLMNADEVSQAARRGIDMQLHTHRHRTPMDRNLFAREIRDNRREIQGMTGTDPVHFCYPSGNYSEAFFPWLRECGVESATTCERGLAIRTANPLLLPRVLDDSTTDSLRFRSFVSGLFA